MSEERRITDTWLKCPSCGYVFRFKYAFHDVDGDGTPGCPICFTPAVDCRNKMYGEVR